MYLMGGLNRYTGRYIGQYSTDVSKDTLSRPGQASANSPLNDAHGVGQHIDCDTVGGILVHHRLYIGQLSV